MDRMGHGAWHGVRSNFLGRGFKLPASNPLHPSKAATLHYFSRGTPDVLFEVLEVNHSIKLLANGL